MSDDTRARFIPRERQPSGRPRNWYDTFTGEIISDIEKRGRAREMRGLQRTPRTTPKSGTRIAKNPIWQREGFTSRYYRNKARKTRLTVVSPKRERVSYYHDVMIPRNLENAVGNIVKMYQPMQFAFAIVVWYSDAQEPEKVQSMQTRVIQYATTFDNLWRQLKQELDKLLNRYRQIDVIKYIVAVYPRPVGNI